MLIRTAKALVNDLRPKNQVAERLLQLEQDIAQATSYPRFHQACLEHDKLSGAEEWKQDARSKLYDFNLIHHRLTQLRAAREQGDVRQLVFHLQESLHGNLGNIAEDKLYKESKCGTKHLIETYLEEVCDALTYLANNTFDELPHREKLAFFRSTGSTFGQSCLMLSGAAALGVYHFGVVKTLFEQDLLPKVISGSSAGSVVAAMVGSKTRDELNEFIYSRDNMVGYMKYIGPSLRANFDADYFEARLFELFGDMTFEEAFEVSGYHINITVSPNDRHQEARLLNHLTSPHVLLRSAVRASCAAPFLFLPSELEAKNIKGEVIPYLKGRKFLDGAIGDDLPITRLQRLYGVNHSIVSMANPLTMPIYRADPKASNSLTSSFTTFVRNQLVSAVDFGLEVVEQISPLESLNFTVDRVQALLRMNFHGDIIIMPPVNPMHGILALRNHSLNAGRKYITIAERQTWEALDQIRNATMISRTFQDCLQRIEHISD